MIIGTTLLCFSACKPDKPVTPSGPSAPVDGRQKFVGMYDVYDTMSNWLYTMEISLHQGVTNVDSIFVANWGGAFNLYIQHDDGNTTNALNLNGQFGIEDFEGYRWALFEEYDPVFMHGRLINDTLRLSYLKDNIAFYVADGVPYFRQSYREFAVKRDWEYEETNASPFGRTRHAKAVLLAPSSAFVLAGDSRARTDHAHGRTIRANSRSYELENDKRRSLVGQP
ncbi:MAG TPA: hypothetical protein PL070_14750 [Flavobacteriales bacterium]|nr:hypothetical protein [Flavobacteriales bacterium]